MTGESFYRLPHATSRTQGNAAADPLAGEHRGRFLEAMDDDFNTGGAMGVLFELVSALNRFVDAEKLENPGDKDAGKVATLRSGAADAPRTGCNGRIVPRPHRTGQLS